MAATNTSPIHRRGLMLVLSSPSGAGKTTIARGLLERDPGITMSVSVTTRAMRPGEVEGLDYYFIDQQRFDRMAETGDLLEHARVFGNCYGTPRVAVEDALGAGRDVLFAIDWQGAQQLAQNARDDLVSVFVLPPSVSELERRLRGRGQDSEEVIANRMAKASNEISHWPEYDYVIVNSDVNESIAAVESILHAERLRRRRQVGLPEFVRSIQDTL
ncbi:guanylate kinase [Azospirillum lipoferum]|uniref:Guanylate kinase n=1 Tax=Azospirillum lipoferum TaxID=193 RepID=A0A5A9GY35_AZOLI|nr:MULTISPECIES: guanylate kinase [Azospirillum]KAA0598692.1 guanylate kinase [Azospirillum lipoferum]MCP1609285.1 guanylate kinase [Azospirillum lipoferum]MDW5535405.1 guanylate kinase [Azospirillum sp. NL1]